MSCVENLTSSAAPLLITPYIYKSHDLFLFSFNPRQFFFLYLTISKIKSLFSSDHILCVYISYSVSLYISLADVFFACFFKIQYIIYNIDNKYLHSISIKLLIIIINFILNDSVMLNLHSMQIYTKFLQIAFGCYMMCDVNNIFDFYNDAIYS